MTLSLHRLPVLASLASLVVLVAACSKDDDSSPAAEAGAAGEAGVTGGSGGTGGNRAGGSGGEDTETGGTAGAAGGTETGGTETGGTETGGTETGGTETGGTETGGTAGVAGGTDVGGTAGVAGGDTGGASGSGGAQTAGAAGTAGSAGAPSTCEQTLCGAACVDLQTDAANCSACADACGASLACVGAVCVGTADSTTYTLELGDPASGEVRFDVSTSGARITTFSLDGHDVLTGPEVNATNFGSTMWTSPQSAWGWPPIDIIDNDPYPTVDVAGNVITMTSDSADVAGTTVTVTKVFTPDTATGSVRIDYTLTNTGSAALDVAAWEITRVPRVNGYVVWPDGTGPLYGRPDPMWDDSDLVSAVEPSGGYNWLAPTTIDEQKVMGDGSGGWMAFTDGNVLFLKSWTDVPANQQFDPEEGEIEFYEGIGYRELEVQGPKTTLAAGASTTFSVTWYIRPLENIFTGTGDTNLIAQVEQILGL